MATLEKPRPTKVYMEGRRDGGTRVAGSEARTGSPIIKRRHAIPEGAANDDTIQGPPIFQDRGNAQTQPP